LCIFFSIFVMLMFCHARVKMLLFANAAYTILS